MRLGNDEALWLLWLLPVLAAVAAWGLARRRTLLWRLAEPPLAARLAEAVSPARQAVKATLLVLAAGAIVVALTRPAWSPTTETLKRKGRDVVVLLDVSRSMLAEDIRPNRLERAKLAISDLLYELQGDRIGIIAFAGRAEVVCPLTHDYGFARMVLAQITPESVTRGGTLIGDAVRKATNEVFDDTPRDFKDIVLITDGEDQDSYPVKAAEQAAAEGIRIFCIGLGSETEGARIPVTGPDGRQRFLTYQGEEVWTRLDGDLLRQIVYATPGGQYLNVATGTFDLVEVYRDLILPADRAERASTTVQRFQERFQIFLALAVVLLTGETLISERRKT